MMRRWLFLVFAAFVPLSLLASVLMLAGCVNYAETQRVVAVPTAVSPAVSTASLTEQAAPRPEASVTPTATQLVLPAPQWSPECATLLAGKEVYTNPNTRIMSRTLDSDHDRSPAVVWFADRQLIFTGAGSAIDEVITAANASPDVNAILSQRGPPLSQRDIRDTRIETRLYDYSPKRTDPSPDAVELARLIRDQVVKRGVLVFVDPNYLAMAQGQPGDRCSAENSPTSGEASPTSGEASPYAAPPGPPPVRFWSQWAFGACDRGGINLVDPATGQRRSDLPTGQGRQIVILDTSPFEQPGLVTFSGAGWMMPTLTICVEHPVTVALTPSCSSPFYQGDHGLFVAGLAHAVAPTSKIHLLRVLNENGVGDTAGIISTLERLDKADLRDSVINLSLGIVPETPPRGRVDREELCEKYEIAPCDMDGFFSLDSDRLNRDDLRQQLIDTQQMVDLEQQIKRLEQKGNVIVAAAGNKSDANGARSAQVPASYAFDAPSSHPNLLAVAATTQGRERAFYSNKGTLAAPGGGDNRAGCQKPHDCTPGYKPCCWERPEDWIISAAKLRDGPNGKPYYSYGAWTGSSFAAPLVSGAAALSRPDPTMTVPEKLKKGAHSNPNASLGAGIICLP